MTSTIGIKLDNETRSRLKALSKQKDRSGHWLMKRAIHEYLDREEKYEQEKQEDKERWELYLDTNDYIDHETMKRKLSDLITKAYDKDKLPK